MSFQTFLSDGFFIDRRTVGSNSYQTVQNYQCVDGRVGEPGNLPFFNIKISCFAAISRYSPRFVLNSVVVTIIVSASFLPKSAAEKSLDLAMGYVKISLNGFLYGTRIVLTHPLPHDIRGANRVQCDIRENCGRFR